MNADYRTQLQQVGPIQKVVEFEPIIGGAITAEQALKLQAGRDIDIASTLTHSDSRSGQDRYQYTGIDRLAGLYVTGAQQPGQLHVQAGRNLTLTAVAVANAGKADESSTTLQAGNDLALKTLTTSKSDLVVSDARNFVKSASSQEVGTQIASEGDIRLQSANDVTLRAADVTSQQGAVVVQAGRDIGIQAGSFELSGTLQNYESKRSGLATKSSVIKSDVQRQTLQGSAVSGDTVSLLAGRDLSIVASDVVSDNNTTLAAKNNVRVEAGTERSREHDYRKTTKSGILSGGTLGFTIGSQSSTYRMDAEGAMQSQARSSVGSLNGDTRLFAGEQLTVRGSDVLAQGDVLLKGKAVVIDPGTDQRQSKEVHEFQKSGLTIGVEVPVVEAVQAAVRAAEQNGKSKNARVNAMAAANTGWSSYKAAQQMGNMGQAMAQLQAGDAKGAASTSGIKVSITYGNQRSRSSTEVQQTQTSGSQVLAQNTVTVLAAGGGADSDITVTGSDIAGKKGTILIADDAISLAAAAQTYKERSKNSSAGGKIGVSAGYENGSAAIGITVGANVGKGHGKGDETRYEYTHVGDRNSRTVLHSGGGTTLKGAQVAGSQVVLQASDLSIESLQDTSTYKGKQLNAQGEVTIGYGASGSGSASKSKISADYASVNELSGIFAQDLGYQIDVDGHTDLTGAVITSSAQAEAAGRNRLTTGTLAARDIKNYSRVKASSVGIGGDGGFMGGSGLGGAKGLQASMGFGSVSSNESSVTKSGINTANINITRPKAQQEKTGKSVAETIVAINNPLTSDEALTYAGLGNSFDKEAVQNEIDLQRDVSQAFSKNSQEASAELKKRIASNDALFEVGLISEQERDTRNASLRNYAWILETVAAGLATPSDSLTGSLVAAASPTIAKEIGQQFKQTGQEGSTGHYLAHAGLGALVAAATGNSIAGNALAAAGSEATAPVAANLIFGKDVSQLTPDEKATVSSIAGLAGARLSGAAGGDGRSLVSGSVAGRTSVENNYLTAEQLDNFAQRAKNCSGASCKKVIQDMVDTNVQQQEEIKAVCSASPEQCQQKYGYLIEQWDVFDKAIKKLAADKTLPGGFRDYMPAVYMMDTEAQGIAVQYGWTKRFETMGLDRETAEMMAVTLPAILNEGRGKGSKGGKVITDKKTKIAGFEGEQKESNKLSANSKKTKNLSQNEVNSIYNQQLIKDAEKISTAKPGKQAVVPRDLNEQMFWQSVQSKPLQGKELPGLNNDPRFPTSAGFQKMEAKHRLPDGQTITIHYQYNSTTGKVYDMKIATPQRVQQDPKKVVDTIKDKVK
ncbi:hemagglutinin repeat-containing protein [Advenella incenata]|uniref:hemagglutinin repeat-containing protein n=1 Tax=Advenella incenata TaxID=267800 RepID=UPI0010294B7A|nr:hemagglutinin repeat-containing protein [Advenella incenata]